MMIGVINHHQYGIDELMNPYLTRLSSLSDFVNASISSTDRDEHRIYHVDEFAIDCTSSDNRSRPRRRAENSTPKM